MATQFPCMECGKPVAKKRRLAVKQWSMEHEACSTKCWNKVVQDCEGDARSEAIAAAEAELAHERHYDCQSFMLHGE